MKQSKKCTICGKRRLMKFYYADKRASDGKMSCCRDCRAEINNKPKYRQVVLKNFFDKYGVNREACVSWIRSNFSLNWSELNNYRRSLYVNKYKKFKESSA